MNRSVSILGCGWLGFPLAQTIVRKKMAVKGSTRSKEKYQILKDNGIEPYLISVPDTLSSPENRSFFKGDTLFLNIPPGRGNPNVDTEYPDKVNAVCDCLTESSDNEGIKKVIFASSTSVYSSDEGIYKEENATLSDTARPSGSAILKAEQALMDHPDLEVVILRFGGLYGYDRHPVRYLAGKKNLSGPLKPVNLIHQDDCIQIIMTLLSSNITSGVYNAVSDGHPPRKTLYQSAAEHYGVEPPTFDSESESVNRVISNEKLKRDLDYSFIYPNPLDHTA